MNHLTALRYPTLRAAAAALFLVAIGLALQPAAAQNAQNAAELPEADPADVESIDAIMLAVYDVISGAAGEERDWDRMRSLFRPEAKLIPTGRPAQNAPFQPFYWTVEEYIERAGPQLVQSGFFETEINRVTERYGNIAHVFSTYESRRNADDAEPFMRGINSFQLVNDGDRWWVVNIFWQGETPNNPIPAEYGG